DPWPPHLPPPLRPEGEGPLRRGRRPAAILARRFAPRRTALRAGPEGGQIQAASHLRLLPRRAPLRAPRPRGRGRARDRRAARRRLLPLLRAHAPARGRRDLHLRPL